MEFSMSKHFVKIFMLIYENNPFQNIDTEDIRIEHSGFDNNNRQNVKNISKEIIDKVNPIEDISLLTMKYLQLMAPTLHLLTMTYQ